MLVKGAPGARASAAKVSAYFIHDITVSTLGELTYWGLKKMANIL